jgi:mono/diheme cytochrome c family protein
MTMGGWRRFALAGLLVVAHAARAGDPAAPPAVPSGPTLVTVAPATDTPTGQRLYGRHCLSCHQADGGGVPNMQPAIVGGTWVTGDVRALALFVLTGGFDSAGRKESDNSNVMPAFSQLSDDELAAVLTYIREKFGKGASAVTAAQVAEARASIPAPN